MAVPMHDHNYSAFILMQNEHLKVVQACLYLHICRYDSVDQVWKSCI